MAVTIQMIETKEFKTKAHGYDPEEVDIFLDEIADEFEEMQREIQSLRNAARQQASAPAPASANTEASEAVQKMLSNAQRVSDETISDARRQAETILSEARVKSDNLISEAKRESTRLQDSLDAVRSAANDYRARFKRLVDDQMHIINSETELFK